jgi:hypothetical protein
LGTRSSLAGSGSPAWSAAGCDDPTFSDGLRTAAVGPARVGSIAPSDTGCRPLAASSSPLAALEPPPDVLSAGRPQGRIPCRDSTARVPPRSTTSPIAAARAGSKAFPLSRMRAGPHCLGDYTPAGQATAIWRDRGHSAALPQGGIQVTRRRSAVPPAPLRSRTADARGPASSRRGSCHTPIDRRSHARRD